MPQGCMAQHCITHCITGQPHTSITGLNVFWWGHHLAAHMGFVAELVSPLTNGIPGSLLPNPSVDVSLQPLQGAAAGPVPLGVEIIEIPTNLSRCLAGSREVVGALGQWDMEWSQKNPKPSICNPEALILLLRFPAVFPSQGCPPWHTATAVC